MSSVLPPDGKRNLDPDAPLPTSSREQSQIPQSTARSLAENSNPVQIAPMKSEKSEEARFEPIHSYQSHSKPMEGIIDSKEETLEKTESRIYGQFSEDERIKLHRLASSMQRFESTRSVNEPGLERLDTLAEVDDDDPRLDPSKPEFDTYVWARAFIRAMDEDDIKSARAGFSFKNLNVSGSGAAVNLQTNFASVFMTPFRLGEFINFGPKPEKKIFRNFNGVVKSGEMLIVLGRPGSGCSTFLKTICGELTGLNVAKESVIHYNGAYLRLHADTILTVVLGISQKQMIKEFKGEVIYNQEVDKHFPHLTVGETLQFAAAARTPHIRVRDISRKTFSSHMSNVVMTIFGLSHTRNTKVGNDFIRGVSGGERKRVSIAEMALAGSPITCWDNSSR